MITGITGHLASGKSLATRVFARHGYRVIDVDLVGHKALKSGDVKTRLYRIFGSGILDRKKKIDRKALGGLVFSNRVALERLNKVIHPVMVRMIRKEIGKNPVRDTVIDAALLHKMGLDRLCDRIILVESPVKLIYQRARMRNRMPDSTIRRILKAQGRLRLKSSPPGITIRNNADLKTFIRRIEELT